MLIVCHLFWKYTVHCAFKKNAHFFTWNSMSFTLITIYTAYIICYVNLRENIHRIYMENDVPKKNKLICSLCRANNLNTLSNSWSRWLKLYVTINIDQSVICIWQRKNNKDYNCLKKIMSHSLAEMKGRKQKQNYNRCVYHSM